MAESFNHFGKIAEALPQVLSQVVRKTAFDLQAHVQGKIRANGQIDTGFMVNSAYVVTDKESTYSECQAPQKGQTLLPEIAKADNPTTAYLAMGASYSADQNYGTRFQPARPYLEPSAEATRPGFEAACAAIEAKLKEAAR